MENNVYKIYNNLDECGRKCLKKLLDNEENEMHTYGVYLEENVSECVINYAIFTHEKLFTQEEFQEMYLKAREECRNSFGEEYPVLSDVWMIMNKLYGFDLYKPEVVFLIENEDVRNMRIPTLKNLKTEDDQKWKDFKVKQVLNKIDDCLDDANLIEELCMGYKKLCALNKADEFKHQVFEAFGKIVIIHNMDLVNFQTQSSDEFCKDLKETIKNYYDECGESEFIIEAFNNIGNEKE